MSPTQYDRSVENVDSTQAGPCSVVLKRRRSILLELSFSLIIVHDACVQLCACCLIFVYEPAAFVSLNASRRHKAASATAFVDLWQYFIASYFPNVLQLTDSTEFTARSVARKRGRPITMLRRLFVCLSHSSCIVSKRLNDHQHCFITW